MREVEKEVGLTRRSKMCRKETRDSGQPKLRRWLILNEFNVNHEG